MNAKRLLCSTLVPALLACGCEHMSHTDKGILTGGAIGAATGAIVGSAIKKPGAGAAIGAAVGGLSGGLAGNSVDQVEHQQQVQQAAAAAPVQGPLQLDEIVQMAHGHISDPVIISKIRASGTVYNLSANDIQYLKGNGVSDAVIVEMNTTATRAPRRVYQERVVQPVYVAPPPPPVRLGIGVGFHRHRHRWH